MKPLVDWQISLEGGQVKLAGKHDRTMNEGHFTFALPELGSLIAGRGLHSFTFQLNVSTLHGIGGACRGCLGSVCELLEGIRGFLRCILRQKLLKVELKWERV